MNKLKKSLPYLNHVSLTFTKKIKKVKERMEVQHQHSKSGNITFENLLKTWKRLLPF